MTRLKDYKCCMIGSHSHPNTIPTPTSTELLLLDNLCKVRSPQQLLLKRALFFHHVLQFSTTFDVLAPGGACVQTTRGIHAQIAPFAITASEPSSSKHTSHAVIAMDIEGGDSGAGDPGKVRAFERRSTLLALFLSDVVIFNMFHNAMGQNDGAGLPLLRRVFQVRNREGQGDVRDWELETSALSSMEYWHLS